MREGGKTNKTGRVKESRFADNNAPGCGGNKNISYQKVAAISSVNQALCGLYEVTLNAPLLPSVGIGCGCNCYFV